MREASTAPVKSATRTLDIIEYVVARDRPVFAQEIASALAIPLSSLSYLLNTLVDREFLTRHGRRYTAGAGLARLQSRGQIFTLAERVAPLVRSLRVQLDETASFFVQRDWQVEAIATETSEQALRYAVHIGVHTPLHGFSAGKAILAALPDETIERFFAEAERPAFTSSTIVSEAALRAEIAAIRRDGIARTREEHTPGIQGIGRAAWIDGELVGAFSVAIPTVRYDSKIDCRTVELLEKACALLAS